MKIDKVLDKNRSWLLHLFQNYCDYTYEFEKKSGKKHFTKTNNAMAGSVSVNSEGKEVPPNSVGGETLSTVSNSTTSSKTSMNKKHSVSFGKKSKKKKRTFVSALL